MPMTPEQKDAWDLHCKGQRAVDEKAKETQQKIYALLDELAANTNLNVDPEDPFYLAVDIAGISFNYDPDDKEGRSSYV